ncbi:MAG: penicillin acylase family protein [Chloroflexi bacterium]|nr:penicillin acylase family protein [Chloroflexota bacterium]
MITLPRSKEDLKAALPDTAKSLRFKGLDGTVEIFRDPYGIPHVKAKTVHDAFFGQGFATAQDRLWHMDYDRHRAYGRWAEYAGGSAVAHDTMMRRFQIAPSVRADYAAVNIDTKAMLDAYAAGVNAFLQSTASLPIEYALVEGKPEPWQPWDCLAVFKVRHYFLGVWEAKLWRARLVNTIGPERTARLFPGYHPGHLLIVPQGATYDGPTLDGLKELSKAAETLNLLRELDAGSNCWVVAGSRTASGKPLVAGDPHRALDVPNTYYQNHIACSEFDVIGFSFPGCPGFSHFGHNAHVAWGATHGGADYQDLYIERFNKQTPPLYEFKGQWRRAEVRRETIQVRGGQPVPLDVTVTHHGPIIGGDPSKGYGIAFRYTATAEPDTGFDSLFRMLMATSIEELDESMRAWVDPGHNFVFADVHGNIGYLNRVKLPIRPMANAWVPVPGWTGEHEWQGFVPFEELARSRNPETGYIVTANNRIVGKDYPHYIALDFAPGFRARRITDRLAQMKKATVADMASVHAERVSIPGKTYARLLAQVQPQDEPSARAKEKLAGWDGTMDRDAVAPTIYSAFRDRLDRLLVRNLLGPLAEEAFKGTGRGAPGHARRLSAHFAQAAEKNETSLLPPGGDWTSLISQALAEGVAYLRERLGDDIESWQWGKVHGTKPQHPLSALHPELAALLNPPSFPMGGDGDTPQAAGYAAANLFAMTGMSVARYAFDTSNWDNSAWIVPGGASGHPASLHYADQAPLWAEIKLVPALYRWERIAKEARSQQKLDPA